MIRIVLPFHLRTLAKLEGEAQLELEGAITIRNILDSLEAKYPVLRGTIRDPATAQRRSFIRFFACKEDLSHESLDARLPEEIQAGTEPFLIVGAMAGG